MSFSSAGIRADAGRQHQAGAFAGSSKLAHALTKATTLGISLLLVALWLALDDETAALKILLVYHMLPPDHLAFGPLGGVSPLSPTSQKRAPFHSKDQAGDSKQGLAKHPGPPLFRLAAPPRP